MDYKEKYKEALERARVYHTGGSISDAHITEVIFPELKEFKESEDKRNIKDLIDELKCSLRMAECQNYTCGGHEKRIALLEWGIAYLEKQMEQKQTWKPNAAQLIVIKSLVEDKNTLNVSKVILRGMLDEFKQYFKL